MTFERPGLKDGIADDPRACHRPVVSTVRHEPVASTVRHQPVVSTVHHQPVASTFHHRPVPLPPAIPKSLAAAAGRHLVTVWYQRDERGAARWTT